MLPPGWVNRSTRPLATGSPTPVKTIGIVRVSRGTAYGRRGPVCCDDVVLQADQLLRERSYPIDVNAAPPKVDPHVAPIGPTQVRKRLSECGEGRLIHQIVFVAGHEHADAPHAVALLRAPRAAMPLPRR